MAELEMVETETEVTGRPRTPDLELMDTEPLNDIALELSTRSVVVLDQMAATAATDLKRAQEALQEAERTFAQRTNRRYFSSDLQHAAAIETHTATMQTALEAAGRAADTVYQLARNLQDATGENREPQLSDADAERANFRREFVKEDCSDLSLGELRAKIQNAIASGDPALCYLYLRYAPGRLKEGRQADSHAPQERENIIELLRNLRDRLTDTRPRGVNEKAKQVRKQAVAFMREVNQSGAGFDPKSANAPAVRAGLY